MNVTDYEILTPQGFSPFVGVQKHTNKKLVTLTFSDNSNLTCSCNHKLQSHTGKFIYARNTLQKKLKTGQTIISITKAKSQPTYDIVGVSLGQSYFTNNVISHNCNMMKDFWESVYPIISSSLKSKIFVASTPKGTGNLFHTLYEGAVRKENGWYPERVDWFEIPGRDEEWRQKTLKTLGSAQAFAQEFGCEFLQTGESSVDEELYQKLKTEILEPRFIFDEGRYLLWDTFKPGNIYTIGVDVSEGVNENASVIQILDITDLRQIEQVAVYYNKEINPLQFIPKCLEIFEHWGNPPVLIERNNCGAQVVDQLKATHGYNNIVSYGPTAAYDKLGVLAHTNTKYRGVMNMRYYINEINAVRIRDINTLNELKNFIRSPNGTWAARGSELDDRVMSLVWALIMLENEVAEKYYEVELDDTKRPVKLTALDYGVSKYFVDPTKTLINMKESDNFFLPTVVDVEDLNVPDDMRQLEKDGWSALNA